jgi:hypothetical protein
MAKIHEEFISFKLSSARRDDDDGTSSSINPQLLNDVQAVIQELVGNSIIVETVSDGE